jgi:glycosyltransferase involved in cell wall biosynthesis
VTERRLKVAWLAPYDLRLLADRLDPPVHGSSHNSAWITNGLRALLETGAVDLHVITCDKRLARDQRFEHGGITFHLLRTIAPVIPRAAVLYRLDVPRVHRTIAAIDPDVVHGHGTESVYAYAAVTSRYPAVISMQAVIAELFRAHTQFSRTWLEQWFTRIVEAQTLRRAGAVFVEAPFVTDLVRRVNPALQVRIAGNIVSAPFFAVQRDRASSSRLLFVGRLTHTKGIEEGISAFHMLAADDERLSLDIVGEGERAYVTGRLARLVAEGAGRNRIVLRGHLDAAAIAAEYRTAAAVVLPTYYDTSPNVIAEAMVAGVPVVAAAVGGLPYMLDDGANGRLVRPRDAAALAGAIHDLLARTDDTAARAARGRVVARGRYAPALLAARMLAMYRTVLGDARAWTPDLERDLGPDPGPDWRPDLKDDTPVEA